MGRTAEYWGKPTLAISSDFLNSPSTTTTFPFSSNSVHRSFSSFVAFILPSVAPLASLRNGSGGRSLGRSGRDLSFAFLRSANQRIQDSCSLLLLLLEPHRRSRAAGPSCEACWTTMPVGRVERAREGKCRLLP